MKLSIAEKLNKKQKQAPQNHKQSTLDNFAKRKEIQDNKDNKDGKSNIKQQQQQQQQQQNKQHQTTTKPTPHTSTLSFLVGKPISSSRGSKRKTKDYFTNNTISMDNEDNEDNENVDQSNQKELQLDSGRQLKKRKIQTIQDQNQDDIDNGKEVGKGKEIITQDLDSPDSTLSTSKSSQRSKASKKSPMDKNRSMNKRLSKSKKSKSMSMSMSKTAYADADTNIDMDMDMNVDMDVEGDEAEEEELSKEHEERLQAFAEDASSLFPSKTKTSEIGNNESSNNSNNSNNTDVDVSKDKENNKDKKQELGNFADFAEFDNPENTTMLTNMFSDVPLNASAIECTISTRTLYHIMLGAKLLQDDGVIILEVTRAGFELKAVQSMYSAYFCAFVPKELFERYWCGPSSIGLAHKNSEVLDFMAKNMDKKSTVTITAELHGSVLHYIFTGSNGKSNSKSDKSDKGDNTRSKNKKNSNSNSNSNPSNTFDQTDQADQIDQTTFTVNLRAEVEVPPPIDEQLYTCCLSLPGKFLVDKINEHAFAHKYTTLEMQKILQSDKKNKHKHKDKDRDSNISTSSSGSSCSSVTDINIDTKAPAAASAPAVKEDFDIEVKLTSTTKDSSKVTSTFFCFDGRIPLSRPNYANMIFNSNNNNINGITNGNNINNNNSKICSIDKFGWLGTSQQIIVSTKRFKNIVRSALPFGRVLLRCDNTNTVVNLKYEITPEGLGVINYYLSAIYDENGNDEFKPVVYEQLPSAVASAVASAVPSTSSMSSSASSSVSSSVSSSAPSATTSSDKDNCIDDNKDNGSLSNKPKSSLLTHIQSEMGDINMQEALAIQAENELFENIPIGNLTDTMSETVSTVSTVSTQAAVQNELGQSPSQSQSEESKGTKPVYTEITKINNNTNNMNNIGSCIDSTDSIDGLESIDGIDDGSVGHRTENAVIHQFTLIS